MRWSAWSGSRGFTLAAMVLFTVMWTAMTYPQVLHMTDRVSDPGDPLLNTWALAWVAHQLPFAPAHVFDGNIFHPERRTLAYSETLLAPGVLGAPLLYLGAGPVLVYNLLMLASFVLSGVGTALLVRDLTGSPARQALVAGAVFAFLPWRFDHYGHFQLLQTQWMPLALWALHRLLREGRDRVRRDARADGGRTGADVDVQRAVLRHVHRGGWRHLAAGGPGESAGPARRLSLVSIVVAGALPPLRWLSSTAARASWWASGHAPRSRWGAPEWPAFPVVAAAQAGCMGDGRLRTVRSRAAAVSPAWSGSCLRWLPCGHRPLVGARRLPLAGLLVSLELARGLNGWLYGALYDHVFAFRSMRVPARMTIVMGMGLAVLAGFGVERLLRLAPGHAACSSPVTPAPSRR